MERSCSSSPREKVRSVSPGPSSNGRSTPVGTLRTGEKRASLHKGTAEDIPLFRIDLHQLITKEGDCNGELVTAVIDTGAAVSVVSPALVAKIGMPLVTWGRPSVVMVNGQKTPSLGVVDQKVTHAVTEARGKALVLDMDGIPLLLGNDFLRHFKRLEILYEGATPQLFLGELPLGPVTKRLDLQPIVAREGKAIPPRTMVAVKVDPPARTKGHRMGPRTVTTLDWEERNHDRKGNRKRPPTAGTRSDGKPHESRPIRPPAHGAGACGGSMSSRDGQSSGGPEGWRTC